MSRQLEMSAMMVRALHVITRAVHEWTVAVPVSRADTMPAYSLHLEVPVSADDAPGLGVMRALEENMGAVATLIPADVAVVVDARDLRVLLAASAGVIGANYTLDRLYENGIATLDGWSRMRERENREREGS